MDPTSMRNIGTMYYRSSFLLTVGLLVLLAACATYPDHPDWMRLGVTTKEDVIARFGQPDVLMTSPGGETAIYHGTGAGAFLPRLEIPPDHVGPIGTSTTRTFDPDPGAQGMDTEGNVSVRRELRIRYDDRGVVQALSFP